MATPAQKKAEEQRFQISYIIDVIGDQMNDDPAFVARVTMACAGATTKSVVLNQLISQEDYDQFLELDTVAKNEKAAKKKLDDAEQRKQNSARATLEADQYVKSAYPGGVDGLRNADDAKKLFRSSTDKKRKAEAMVAGEIQFRKKLLKMAKDKGWGSLRATTTEYSEADDAGTDGSDGSVSPQPAQ